MVMALKLRPYSIGCRVSKESQIRMIDGSSTKQAHAPQRNVLSPAMATFVGRRGNTAPRERGSNN